MTHRIFRSGWRGLVALLAVCMAGTVPHAYATVTWTVDATGKVLTISATAAEPLVVVCTGGVVATTGGITTTAVCSTLTSLTALGSGANDTIDLNSVTTTTFPTLATITVNGKAGDDRITGSPRADILYGGSGNDRIKGGKGDDNIQGNAGNDSITGGLGTDVISGGAGDDSLTGHIDFVAGPAADDYASDTIRGDDGFDRIVAQDMDTATDNGLGADSASYVVTGTPSSTMYTLSSRFTSFDVTIRTAGIWSIANGGDGAYWAMRERAAAAGAPREVIDFDAFATRVTMSDGTDTFYLGEQGPGGSLALNGAGGTDTLKVVTSYSPGSVIVTANEIQYPNGFNATYTGFESVKVISTATPAVAAQLIAAA